MFFQENELLIPQGSLSKISLIPEKDPVEEHFTEADYQAVQERIRALNAKNEEIQQRLEEREGYLEMISQQNEKYQTFYKMFENTEERNQSYYKTIQILIFVIFLLIIIFFSHFLYSRIF